MSKAEDRRIAANLKRHNELVTQGMTSEQAFREITGRPSVKPLPVAVINEIRTCMSVNYTIPLFSVTLRHPVHGWQVVAVGTSNHCDKEFKRLKRQTLGTCSMKLLELHDGAHGTYTVAKRDYEPRGGVYPHG